MGDVSNIVQQGAIEPTSCGTERQRGASEQWKHGGLADWRTGDRARCAHNRALAVCAPMGRQSIESIESIDAIGGHRLLSAVSPASLHASLRSAEHFLACLRSRSTSHWHTLTRCPSRVFGKGNRPTLPCTLPILASIDRLLSPGPSILFLTFTPSFILHTQL